MSTKYLMLKAHYSAHKTVFLNMGNTGFVFIIWQNCSNYTKYKLVRCKLIMLSTEPNSHALLTMATLNDSTSSYLKKG